MPTTGGAGLRTQLLQETTVLRSVCANHCMAFRPQARIILPGRFWTICVLPLAPLPTRPHMSSPRTTPTAILPLASLGPIANSLILSCAGRQLVSFCAGYAGLDASGGGDLVMARSEGRTPLVNRLFYKNGKLVGMSQTPVTYWCLTQTRTKRTTRAKPGMLGAKRRGS